MTWCCRRRDQHEAIERYERESTIYNMEQRGEFPERFYLTSRCVVWDLAEVVTLTPCNSVRRATHERRHHRAIRLDVARQNPCEGQPSPSVMANSESAVGHKRRWRRAWIGVRSASVSRHDNGLSAVLLGADCVEKVENAASAKFPQKPTDLRLQQGMLS
jgi:Prophage CP4-57 regulatory protein (AlpA)